MKPRELREAIARGREQRSVEFKSPGPRGSKRLFARVARAMLAMSNTRDGGSVVLGVEETDDSLNPVGVDGRDRRGWKHAQLADAISTYVEPHLEFVPRDPATRRRVSESIRSHSALIAGRMPDGNRSRPNQDLPALASMAFSSTLAPAARSAAAANSASLWLMPSLHGTKTIAVGTIAARFIASCPAPLIISR